MFLRGFGHCDFELLSVTCVVLVMVLELILGCRGLVTWETNRANSCPAARPGTVEEHRSLPSHDTSFSRLESHSELVARFDTFNYHIRITPTIAAGHALAITADPTSSPTKASHSRAPSAQLTVIQSSHRVSWSKRGGFKESHKEPRTLLLWEASCKHGQGLAAQRALLHPPSCITFPTFGGDNLTF